MACRVGRLSHDGSRSHLSVVPKPVSPPAEKRLCMNVYVLMIACVSCARGWNRSPPRWRARRRRCSPNCSLTPHETARPSRARQASSTRNRPHIARANHVSALPSPLPAFLPARLRNKPPSPAELLQMRTTEAAKRRPTKGVVAKSVKPRARDAARRRDLPVYLPFHLPFGLPFHLPIRPEHPVSTELTANAHNQAGATAPDKGSNHEVDKASLSVGRKAGAARSMRVQKPAASGSLRACDPPMHVISSTIHKHPRRRRQ